MAAMAYSPVSWQPGELITHAKVQQMVDNIEAVKATADGLLAGWSSFTPVFPNLTLGNGTLSAKYTRLGRTVHFLVRLTLGTSSTVNGILVFSTPLPIQNADGLQIYGHGMAADASAAGVGPGFYLRAWSGTQLVPALHSNGAGVGPGTPFVWASGDVFTATGTYEAAP